MKKLKELPIPSPHMVDELERAIAGEVAYCPIPAGKSAGDTARASSLRATQRIGESIDDDVALVVATSGSTGVPKGALLTAHNLVSGADATHARLGGPRPWLCALPAHNIAGLQILIRSLVAGYDPLVMDVSQGFDVAEFAQYTAELGAGGYTSLVPNQLAKLLRTLQGVEALQQYEAILVGGAPITGDMAHRAERLGINIVTTYGSSETSGGCVYDGTPIPGAKVQLHGERIWLGGPMVAKGYRNVPSDEAFPQPGWFRTSDAGHIVDGKLQVIGRLDAIIDSGGLKLHPEVLEKAILQVPGVTEVVVVGVPDPRLGSAISAVYAGTPTPAQVIEGLADLPRWQLPKHLSHVADVPRMTSGKVDRKQAEKLILASTGLQ